MNQIKGDMIEASWESLVTLLKNNPGQVLARKARRLPNSLVPYQNVLNSYRAVLRQYKNPRRKGENTGIGRENSGDSVKPEDNNEEMGFVRRLQIPSEIDFGSYPETTIKRLSLMLNLTSINPQTYKGELKL